MYVFPEQFCDEVYAAVSDPDHWAGVLRELSRTVSAVGALLLTRRGDDWVGWRHSFEPRYGVDAYLLSPSARSSRTTERLVGLDRAGFVADWEVFTPEELACDVYMTEWAGPHGLGATAATAIRAPHGDLVVVHLVRRAGEPEFSKAELSLLDTVRPHLARAGMLAARWRLDRIRSAAEALALVGLPTLVLDANGRVLVANSLIQVDCPYLVWRPGDKVAFIDGRATQKLHEAVLGAGDHRAASGATFAVRPERGATCIAHVVPITGAGRELFGGGLTLLVLTPTTAVSVDLSVIRGLFDLTPREAEVAAAIAEGLDTDEIALRHQVTRETARTQIKSVLAKSGARRRSEAASLIAGIPRLPLARGANVK